MAENYKAPADLERYRAISLGIGGIALIAWAVGVYFNTEQALRSWLLGFIFWGGIAIGSIGVLMLQYLTGGAWGVVIRRAAEAATRTLPLVFILWIPLLVGVNSLYKWTDLPPDDPTVLQRGIFMTPSLWGLRTVFYFAAFGLLVYLLNKWSSRQDGSKDHEQAAEFLGRSTKLSGPSMFIYVVLVTFASVDWVMSLDPHWFSTIYGLLFTAGWGLSAFCFLVVILAMLGENAPMNHVLGRRHFHDIGKLILALVMVWAYFSFSQLLIIYSGNIPEETIWFIERMSTGWFAVGMVLILFHFAFPFLLLLRQDLKRSGKTLALIAIFILFMRLVDMFYYISPNPRMNGTVLTLSQSFSWLDIAGTVAVGGVWLWYFFGQLMKRPLVPVMDPFLESAVEHGHGH